MLITMMMRKVINQALSSLFSFSDFDSEVSSSPIAAAADLRARQMDDIRMRKSCARRHGSETETMRQRSVDENGATTMNVHQDQDIYTDMFWSVEGAPSPLSPTSTNGNNSNEYLSMPLSRQRPRSGADEIETASIMSARMSSKSFGDRSGDLEGSRGRTARMLPLSLRSDMAKVAWRLEQSNWQPILNATRSPQKIGAGGGTQLHFIVPVQRTDDAPKIAVVEQRQEPGVDQHSDLNERLIDDDDGDERPEQIRAMTPTTAIVRMSPHIISGDDGERAGASNGMVGSPMKESSMIGRPRVPSVVGDKDEVRESTMGCFDQQLDVWSGGNMKGDGVLPLSTANLSAMVARERCVHHTRIEHHDAGAALRFLPRATIMSRTIHTIIMLSIGDEPVEWLSDTITSIADAVREIIASVRKPLSWESIVLVLECANDAPSETLWLLETLGLLRPKCFDVLPSASCHVFEITLDTAKFCSAACNSIDPNGPVPSPRSCPLQVALVVRCTPTAPTAIALFANRLDHLQYVLRVPTGGIIQIGALSALIDALDNDPFVDAALGVMSPVSIISALISSPCVSSEAHNWVSSALLADQTSSGCGAFCPPSLTSLSLSRATPSSLWRTLIVMEARLEMNLPKSALLVLDSARNDKARQWINLMGQWRRSRLRDLPRLVILTVEALLWFFNLSLVWAFTTFTTTFSAAAFDTIGPFLFQLLMTLIFVSQTPLLMGGASPSLRAMSIRVVLWSGPAMITADLFLYLSTRKHLVESVMHIFHTRTLTVDDADIIAMAGVSYFITVVLIVAFLYSQLTFVTLSLPLDLAVFPGRFISAVPNSIGNLKDTHARASFATAWVFVNAAAIIAINDIPVTYLILGIAFASASLALITTYQLYSSLINALIFTIRKSISARTEQRKTVKHHYDEIHLYSNTSSSKLTSPSSQAIDNVVISIPSDDL